MNTVYFVRVTDRGDLIRILGCHLDADMGSEEARQCILDFRNFDGVILGESAKEMP